MVTVSFSPMWSLDQKILVASITNIEHLLLINVAKYMSTLFLLLYIFIHTYILYIYTYVYMFMYRYFSLSFYLSLSLFLSLSPSLTIYMYVWVSVYVFGLVWFYDISTIVGYFIPNSLFMNVLNIWFVNTFCRYTQLNDQTFLFLTI